MNDLISRQAAIDALWKISHEHDSVYYTSAIYTAVDAIEELPSAQPEQPSEIQDILDYLDTALHPIISPEHWNVYSELHDMISTLPSAQPQWIPCSERLPEDDNVYFVTVHPGYIVPGGLSVDMLHWYDGKWWFDYYGQPAEFTDPIIAWMPLPEPWKGEER